MLVTGADGALGRIVMDRFVRSGCMVMATSRSTRPTEARDSESVTWLQADLSNPASVRALASQVAEIDGLVHCAGGFRYAEIGEIKDEDIEFLIDANLKSSILLLREFIPRMKEQNFGRVVLVSAKSTLNPTAGFGFYTATKAGLNALVASVADEVKKSDINVMAVMPSVIDTAANRRDMPTADFSSWVSLGELAEIIFSLTQELGHPLNGALIPVSGRL